MDRNGSALPPPGLGRTLSDDLMVAFQLADVADQIVTTHFRPDGFPFENKYDGSPVTEIDRAVEQAIRERLAFLRPGDSVLGEEGGQGGGDSKARWIVDPIDGTRKFVRGISIFATLLALEIDGEIVVGMASAPLMAPTGRRWWAMRGLGAYTDGRLIEVSKVGRLADAHVLHGSAEGWVRKGHGQALLDLAMAAWGSFAPGDFWMHVLVAEGLADAAVEPEAAIWDLAALKLIVEEAGGRFSDFAGNSGPAGGNGVSSNGLIHDEILALLRRP